MKMNKTGQLTIFIIIGIVLLFSAALIIYIKQSIVQYKPPVEITLEQVPTEIQPLQRFVSQCVEMTAKEAVIKAGLQGGYVDSSSIAVNDNDPTSGEGIAIPPGGNIKIPYWYYMKSKNTCDSECEFSSHQPSLYATSGTGNSIEEQISKYVQEKMSSCVRDFVDFRQQFEVQQNQITAKTTIAATDVFVEVEYPLTVTLSGRVEKLSKFAARLNVNLGKLYDVAAELSDKEINTNFLGHLAMNLVDIYSGLDENKLPPPADFEFFSGGFKSWMQSDVKSKVTQILMNHVQAVQTVGSLNFEGNYYKGSDTLARGLYSLFILPNLTKTRGVQTGFDYLDWWPIYLHITPSEGEVIKPETSSGFSALLSTFAINQYRFAYDISYPVLVTLTDPTAFDGEGYTFQFALEDNVRNNYYMTPDTSLLSYAGSSRSTLACKSSNFNSAEVTIDVVDSITKEPVEDAVVHFSLGKEACLIGTTQITSLNGIKRTVLKTKMPVGIGALIIEKDDYISKTIRFVSSLDEKQDLKVELNRYVTLNLSVARVPVTNSQNGWSPKAAVPDLEPTEEAAITLIRATENAIQEEYVATAQMKGTSTRMIKLVPGDYEIIGNLFDNQYTVIPEEPICYDDDFWDQYGLGDQKCTTIPSIEYTKFPKGGVSIDSFTISAEMLKDANAITIYLFSAPDGYTRDVFGVTNLKHDDIGQTGKIEQYSRDYFEMVRPSFTK